MRIKARKGVRNNLPIFPDRVRGALLQSQVGNTVVEDVLEIINHAAVLAAELANALLAHVLELLVPHGNDHAVIGALLRLTHRGNAVLVLGLFGIHPRVVHIHLNVILLELVDHVDDAGVAQVRAVFLEGQAHDQDF